jgi:hypothetical protein
MKPRKAHPLDELLRDQNFAYHIGQLMGAVEMASWRLSQSEDKEMQDLGRKLGEISGWFFTPLMEEQKGKEN